MNNSLYAKMHESQGLIDYSVKHMYTYIHLTL